MRGTVIYKMSGSGNDFVFVDGRMSPLDHWGSAAIRRLCDRRTGVGADGFVVLEPGSRAGRVRFHYFNADGTKAAMCGNGALCATQLACTLEMVPGPQMVLESDAGEIASTALSGAKPRAQISLPGDLSEPTVPQIGLRTGESSVHFVTAGVPHLVIVVEHLTGVPVAERGRELRNHNAVGHAGANVNFVGRDEGEAGDWGMRTYERGVEAETLACGTGAVACAAALISAGAVKDLPWVVFTSSGESLSVGGTIEEPKRLVSPTLAGDARIIFKAVLS